jgi:small ligand-binding sensory domain FIST
VQGWKPADEHGVLACDGQFLIAILLQATPQQGGIDNKISTPQAVLDGDLLKACGRKHG